jgi:hypothetical protein
MKISASPKARAKKMQALGSRSCQTMILIAMLATAAITISITEICLFV